MNRTEPTIGGNSPWGRIQGVTRAAPGIVFVDTPGHGGAWLSSERLAAMPLALERIGTRSKYHPGWIGWFEEDCEWAAVAVAFPEEFPEAQADARKMLLDVYGIGGAE